MITPREASGTTEDRTDTEVVLRVQRHASSLYTRFKALLTCLTHRGVIETEIPIDTMTAHQTDATMIIIDRAEETNHAIGEDREIGRL